MEKGKTFYLRLILLFISFIFSTPLYLAQIPNWTNVKETNINVSNSIYNNVDIFTNRYGNHIIVQEDNNLKYYKMNINGQAGSPITIEGTSVISPSICGNGDYIYIVYGMSNQIKVKRSTNGGTSWSSWSSFSITTTATKLESIVSNGKLHITYLESNVIKYRYRTTSTWSSIQEVSEGETGIEPRITSYFNNGVDRVYFLYQKDYYAKWRYYDFNNPNHWGPLNTACTQANASYSGFRVDNSNVVIYYIFYQSYPMFQYFYRWEIFDLNNNYLGTSNSDVSIINWKTYSTQTEDGKSHTAYFYIQYADGEYSDIGLWRDNFPANYPTDELYEYNEVHLDDIYHINISSAGNEVHIIWQDEFGNNNGNNLRYKYDDQNPIPPKNVQVNRDANNHPYLTWSANTEPDLQKYVIQKDNGQGWQNLFETTNLYYEDATETYCTAIPPAECEDEYTVYYHIRAVDINSHQSDPSNDVRAYVTGGHPEKGVSDNFPISYKLDQNFPNPFNPTTSISYSLEKDGFTTLKVYDMLGREVAELVNGNQYAGIYTVEFNAINFPSGIYIYQIKSGSFNNMKKMLLIK